MFRFFSFSSEITCRKFYFFLEMKMLSFSNLKLGFSLKDINCGNEFHYSWYSYFSFAFHIPFLYFIGLCECTWWEPDEVNILLHRSQEPPLDTRKTVFSIIFLHKLLNNHLNCHYSLWKLNFHVQSFESRCKSTFAICTP